MQITKKLRNNLRILNHIDLIKKKEDYYSKLEIGVIELHLTQKCDLKCFYCSYGKNQTSHNEVYEDFPFDQLDKLLELNPKAIVLAGGGEPLLYSSNGKILEDVINYIKTHKPDCKIGLITNGIRSLDKKHCDMLEWVRISLDATNINDFASIKSGNFSKRIDTLKEFVSNNINNVGIGLLYNRFNFNNIYNDLVELYSLLESNIEPDKLNCINVQYRATCPIESCECPSENYNGRILMTPNTENWWKDLVLDLENKLNLVNINSKFGKFLNLNTNISDILENKYNSRLTFNKCYISFSRWIISSDGNIYPCVMKLTNKNNKIGNILTDSSSIIISNEKNYYNLNDKLCTGPQECCKVNGLLNNIVEQNYNNNFEIDPYDIFF